MKIYVTMREITWSHRISFTDKYKHDKTLDIQSMNTTHKITHENNEK